MKSLFTVQDAIYNLFGRIGSSQYKITPASSTYKVTYNFPHKRPHYHCSRSGKRWK